MNNVQQESDVRKLIMINLSNKHRKEAKQFFSELAAVKSLVEVEDGFSFILVTLHQGVREYFDFLECIHETFEIIELKDLNIRFVYNAV